MDYKRQRNKHSSSTPLCLPSSPPGRAGRVPHRAQGSRCSCAEVSPGSIGSDGPVLRGLWRSRALPGALPGGWAQRVCASSSLRRPGSPRSQSAHFNSSCKEAGLDVWPPSSASELGHQEPRRTGHPWSWEPEACPAVGTWSCNAASGGRSGVCGRLQSLGDSQVGSTGLCAPETPIRKTV